MSSVTRFLRQIPVGQPTYGIGINNSLNVVRDAACVLVPSSGNYVGNYPPGLVAPADAGLKNAIVTADDSVPSTYAVVRDMGKTIFAQTADTVALAQAGTGNGSWGYFRQVQLLLPQPITTTQGFLGGTNGSVFGVYGGSPPYAPYLTFYVPIDVAGVSNTTVAVPLPQSPHGQM